MSIETKTASRGMSVRPRRLRASGSLRELVRETRLTAEQLIMPHFVLPTDHADEPIPSMPGISRYGLKDLVARVVADAHLGIRSVLLFGTPEEGAKDEQGTAASLPDSAVARAVAAIKEKLGDDIVVITDVCLCAYTSHGHCGVLRDGKVINDETLPLLARMAVAHARAGADLVAPSDMMDGRVGAIRQGLDDAALSDVGVLAYAVKYASAYYGPFRDAAESSPASGDRKTYQMDPANVREAIREARLDEEEGADILMVKPALAYLDVINTVAEEVDLPVAAYNVSGEYALLRAAAEKGWIDYDRMMMETLLSIRRAGAEIILTYHAKEAARLL